MRILVVEDDRRMADLLREGLVEDGHTVSVAVDGREGLALAGIGAFDLRDASRREIRMMELPQ